MSDKHLATGSALPAKSKDMMRIYSMRFCPYAERTRLVLAHKQIPFETVNVNLRQKPEWLLDRNPLGKVPVVEINDEVVYDSTICDEYLDEKYPDKKMLPVDPYHRARAKILMDGFDKVIRAFYASLRGSDEEKAKAVNEELPNQLDRFEKALSGRYFGGDSANMIDAHLWPYFERFPSVKDITGVEILTAKRFPKLRRWTEDMLETPMVKACYTSPEKLTRYIKSSLSGTPEYDPEY